MGGAAGLVVASTTSVALSAESGKKQKSALATDSNGRAVDTYVHCPLVADVLSGYVRSNRKNAQVTEADLYKKLKAELDIDVSNAGYHYMGKAPFHLMIGDAFANAMAEMMNE